MAIHGQTFEQERTREGSQAGHNVGLVERIASVVGGGSIAAYGLRRRGLGGLALAALGGSLVYRGATGHCGVYERLGIDRTQEPDETAGPMPTQAARLVTVTNVNKSPEELYRFWHHFENLPQFMQQLESVSVLDERHSHWVAKAPFGASVAWDAEITEDEPNRRIAWRSLPGADIGNRGEVDFIPAAGGRGTDVYVRIEYRPPGGRLAVGLARLFGEAPEQRVREDVRRFKQLMETGEVTSNAGPSCR